MDIEDYERNIMRPEDWPYIVKTSEENVFGDPRSNKGRVVSEDSETEIENISKCSPPPTPPPPVKKSLFDLHGNIVESPKSWNRCKFSCKICPSKTTIEARMMRLHIQGEHKLKMSTYTEKYGSIETKRRTFKCELCESQMKFARYELHQKSIVNKFDYKIILQYRLGDFSSFYQVYLLQL